jgi:hypothetical protein
LDADKLVGGGGGHKAEWRPQKTREPAFFPRHLLVDRRVHQEVRALTRFAWSNWLDDHPEDVVRVDRHERVGVDEHVARRGRARSVLDAGERRREARVDLGAAVGERRGGEADVLLGRVW